MENAPRGRPVEDSAPPAPKRPGLGLAVGTAGVAFVVVVAATMAPPDPEVRLPRQYRLAGLIERQADTAEQLRAEVADLRAEVETLGSKDAARRHESRQAERALEDLGRAAGLGAMSGPGLVVSLADSDLVESPSGNVNDLLIHSQDVRAVVNALWRAGAEAIAVNGQRLVGTSAVVCVGNTLLVNGTVHSPPYVAEAIGADRKSFDEDPLMRRLRREAVSFRFGFSVQSASELHVEGFGGAVAFRHARPAAESPAR